MIWAMGYDDMTAVVLQSYGLLYEVYSTDVYQVPGMCTAYTRSAVTSFGFWLPWRLVVKKSVKK